MSDTLRPRCTPEIEAKVFAVITTALHLTRRNELHRECARIALAPRR
ncbi:MAG TPA: hypothetical protein VHW00_14855 [Thermoanaerobaculia bacterium]|nr:hypothetical protein [Thermoanaerobaculia bacterium]